MLDVTSAVICQLVGIDPVKANHQCYGSPSTANNTQVSGIVGLSTSYIGALYTPPAATSEYIGYLADNFGIAGHALAGFNGNPGIPPPLAPAVYVPNTVTGFDALQPVLQLWNFTKNLAYLMLTLVFLFIGLGVMLRIKLDPRTVISLQNQIPKVIIGIILITFSYAIVGLLVDVMWATTYFGINLLASQSNDPQTVQRATENLYSNPLTYVSSIFVKPDNGLAELYSAIDQERKNLDTAAKALATDASTSAAVNDVTTSVSKVTSDITSSALASKVYSDAQAAQSNVVAAKNDIANSSNPNTQTALADISTVSNDLGSIAQTTKSEVTSGGSDVVSWTAGKIVGATTIPTNISSNGIVNLTLDVASYLGDIASESINGLFPPSGNDCVSLSSGISANDCVHDVVNFFTKILAVLIVGIALFIILIRIWFMLIKAYAYVIIDTIVAPLWIIAGFIPGSSFGFNTWIRHIIAYLAVFPATLMLILMAKLLLEIDTIAQAGNQGFLPPLVGNLSLANNVNSNVNFGSLLALGLLFLIPELVTMLKDALKVKSKPYLGKGVKEGIAAGMIGAIPARNVGYNLFGPGDRAKGLDAGFFPRLVRDHVPGAKLLFKRSTSPTGGTH